MAEFVHRLCEMAFCLCLIAAVTNAAPLPAQISPGSVSSDAKVIQTSSAALAKDTARVADQVLDTFGKSKSKSVETKKALAKAEAENAAELAKITSDVGGQADEATKAVSDADAAVAKITSDAAKSIKDINDEAAKAKVDAAADTAKAKTDVSASTAQSKLALELKRQGAEKKMHDAEVAASQAAEDSAYKSAAIISKGSADIAKKVEANNKKLEDDTNAAATAAANEATLATKAITDKTAEDLRSSVSDAATTAGKLSALKAGLVEAKAESVKVIESAMGELLNSEAMLSVGGQ